MKNFLFSLCVIFIFGFQSNGYSQCDPPSTGGVTLTSPGQATLSATTQGAGAEHYWYTSPSGGSPIDGIVKQYVGTAPVTVTTYTAYFSSTTTYYVSSYYNGCTSSRTPVIVTVGSGTVVPSVSLSSDRQVTGGGNGYINISVCSGLSLTLTANPVNGGSPTYQWYKNDYAISGATGASYTTSSLASGDKFGVVMTSSLPNASPTTASYSAYVTVLPSTTSVSISPAYPSIYQGQNLTFTATPYNGGSPTYSWKVNGITQSATGSTFSSSSFNNGDIVYVTMTSSAPCLSTNTVNSNSVTVNVTTPCPLPNTSGTITISSPGEATLTAVTNASGVTHNWYTSPTYGYPISGPVVRNMSPYVTTYTSYFSYGTTTYYISTYRAGVCESARVPASVKVGYYGAGENDEIGLESEQISVFPNPVEDQLNIQLKNIKDASLSIYNNTGSLVKTAKITDSGSEVDVSGLPEGIYVISAVGEGKSITKKFVKE